jgi:glycosyltransferase involved in cell wall biosynthesis
MNILYVSYDGITDHIGQSQVAPYLFGLAKKGHAITLLSAEKTQHQDIIKKYKALFVKNDIEWQIVTYHKKPAVISSVWDVYQMMNKAKSIISRNKIEIIHCRSYIASLIGLHFKKKMNVKFIFDMRDFWPDAAKEIKRFDVEGNRVHKLVYKFFKKKEKEFLEHADHIISLTHAGKKVLEQWRNGEMNIKAPVSVIPCCADFEVFNRDTLDPDKLSNIRSSLGISTNDFVLNYLGSLGPTYMLDEMMDVFKVLLKKQPFAKFLIVANNDHHLAKEAALKKGIDINKIIITKGKKDEIPYFIAISNLSIFFIIPSFAKQACSPTKLAELLAMNVPVIANTRVGDLDSLLNLENNSSQVILEFSEAEYERVLDDILNQVEKGNNHIRNCSTQFSLDTGIELYAKVYQSLTAPVSKRLTEIA